MQNAVSNRDVEGDIHQCLERSVEMGGWVGGGEEWKFEGSGTFCALDHHSGQQEDLQTKHT